MSNDNTVNTDPNVPVDSDKHPIKWDGNNATVFAVLAEIEKWCKRTNKFMMLIKHRAVLIRGRLHIDSIQAVQFITGVHDDPHTLMDPCTRTSERVEDFKLTSGGAFTSIAADKEGDVSKNYSVSPAAVDQEDADFLTALGHVVAGADSAEELLDEADGSGIAFINLFKAKGAKATGRDKTLVTVNFNTLKRDGVLGELTTESFRQYLKAYTKEKKNLAADIQPSPESELEMINTIAYKDPAVRDKYELTSIAKPPTTFAEAAEIVYTILRDGKRSEQIDNATSGAPAAPPADPSNLAMLALEQQITELQEALAAVKQNKDPRKNRKNADKDKDKDKKVKIPRNPDGSIVKWVTGMQPCKCGGNHLFRDCKADSKPAEGIQAAGVADHALHIEDVQALSSAELHAQLNQFFDGAEPATVQEAAVSESEPVPVSQSESAVTNNCVISYMRSARVLATAASARLCGCARRTVAFAACVLVLLLATGGFAAASYGALAASRSAAATFGAPSFMPSSPSGCAMVQPISFHSSVMVATPCWDNVAQTNSSDRPPAVHGRPPDRPIVSIPTNGFNLRSHTVFSVHLVWTLLAVAAAAVSARPPGQPRDFALCFLGALVSILHASICGFRLLLALAIAGASTLATTAIVAAWCAVALPTRLLCHAARRANQARCLVVICVLLLSAWGIGSGSQRADTPRVRSLSLPRNRQWLPKRHSASDFSHRACNMSKRGLTVPLSALIKESARGKQMYDEEAAGTAVGKANRAILSAIDSGCTGSLTWNINWLVNTRSCSEQFRAADGKITTCTTIGDMPALVRLSDGTVASLLVTNVRCVPSFRYTLLSVTQLWEEQHIDARFADIRALVMPGKQGIIPYQSGRKLPTVRMVSAIGLSPPPPSSPRTLAAATVANGSGDRPPSGNAPAAAGSGSTALNAVGFASSPLGFHKVGATAHVGNMPAARAAELMHRRNHSGVDKIRASAHTCSDVPKNVGSATAVTCDACALARIKRASHSGTLSAPAPEPGLLHIDIKEMVLSKGGYRYIVFAIDEYSRYVFYDIIKLKSEAGASVERLMAAFNATVGTPIDSDGRALPRPKVRAIHSDREGKLMSAVFRDFRAKAQLHHTVSPPHDHDLNPIAERIIGLISENASAIKSHSDAPIGMWPHIIAYAVDWHNSMVTSAGSSSADAQISPHQRLTLRPPSVMDLATFGCMAVVRRPPTHLHKPSLTERGWMGKFLGRSRYSKGCWDVLVDGSIVSSSSVLVDEERFPWSPPERAKRPLSSLRHAPRQPQQQPLVPASQPAGASASAPATFEPARSLKLLNLFSGPYSRSDGLATALTQNGWSEVDQIDNSGERGGGWSHDLLNDETYSRLLALAAAGKYDAIMIAFPCSTFSITRFFDASTGSGHDAGPPVIRTAAHPDGLPASELNPSHELELKLTNQLLERTVNIAIAARRSPKQSTVIFENPADRSDESFVAYNEKFKEHGSVFATSAFKRLCAAVGMANATFAYCRLDSPYQKYTTLYYSKEAGSILDALNGPEFKCNHPRGTHSKQAGGRDASGAFTSSEAAAYPAKLCSILARAFTLARTGSAEAVAKRATTNSPTTDAARAHAPAASPSSSGSDARFEATWQGAPTPPLSATSAAAASPAAVGSPGHSGSPGPTAGPSPLSFPDLASPPIAQRLQRARGAAPLLNVGRADQKGKSYGNALGNTAAQLPVSTQLPVAVEVPGSSFTPGGTAVDAGYVPFDPQPSKATLAGDVEEAVASAVFLASHDLTPDCDDALILPISPWHSVGSAADLDALSAISTRLPGGRRAIQFDVALRDDESPTLALLTEVTHALRADSPDAPSTHAEAMLRGEVWVKAERTELDNHKRNGSWTVISRSAVPAGRRLHRMIWVYKVKRDGTAKARLCVQGSSLEAGVDFDQVFSAALRYSSARTLFASAARDGCEIRSIDLVAAYLQGSFLEGEVVFCHLPPGHEQLDSKGRPMVARIEKPIYGIQQAGRRLQRQLFAWLRDQGFKSLDDSDPCVFTRAHANGEIIKIGVYVDNLQIVHSAKLGADGRGPKGCEYNTFVDKLASDWEVVDEGPMDDLLGIEVERNSDGSITLHQRKYIEKIVARFLPNGVSNRVQRNTLPYSSSFLKHHGEAVAQTECEYPELVREMQERIGCLMYAATSTRCDIAYPVHKLCQCLTKPTPDLIRETDHVFAYLARHSSVGLTYTREYAKLVGYADASWETRNSTSGWVVLWQSAVIAWGSHKQKSVALSTCEAEIIA